MPPASSFSGPVPQVGGDRDRKLLFLGPSSPHEPPWCELPVKMQVFAQHGPRALAHSIPTCPPEKPALCCPGPVWGGGGRAAGCAGPWEAVCSHQKCDFHSVGSLGHLTLVRCTSAVPKQQAFSECGSYDALHPLQPPAHTFSPPALRGPSCLLHTAGALQFTISFSPHSSPLR